MKEIDEDAKDFVTVWNAFMKKATLPTFLQIP